MANVIVRNNVKVLGDGEKTILFGHGFGCSQSMWRLMVPFFESKYRIVLFDYVGSGKSDLTAYDPEKYNTLNGYAQDLIEIIEELDLNKVIFVGHSVSSMIGMLASIKRPDYFENIIMIGPSPRYLNDGAYVGGFESSDVTELLDLMEMNFEGWASFMSLLAMQNPEKPMLAQELEKSFTSVDEEITRQFAKVTFLSDHREDLAQSTVPTLIIQCSHDSIVPIEVGEFLHHHLKNSTFRLMKAKGHYPHLSHSEETARLINEYLLLS
ncbi:sigma factor sigB regulation protein rsbQ [Bacillus sp. FJAT-22090]|uniref:alpha/beta fold hydrolase n=1 Tax=Bacillus sp. FJAT-22090 TaxID=1581038 RepID=UPI0006AF8637|nr:alpha/beta hydrolase [Bacillus sp. FJAT-22090]ALC87205.1 sigma factor sigB regulation protein rsbQ [Bacillus sp. FJAT-22090]